MYVFLTFFYLYRDGFTAADFHKACDNKGPTIAIIQTEEGYLCGGYIPITLNCGGWKTHPDFFLFTFCNPHLIPPTKYNLKEGSKFGFFDCTGFHVSFGMDEGSYHVSFRVSDNYLWTKFGGSYIDTTGQGDTTFTGKRISIIEDIEVYSTIYNQ